MQEPTPSSGRRPFRERRRIVDALTASATGRAPMYRTAF